jgi:hypothetical protein
MLQHFGSVGMARAFADVMDLEDDGIVEPFIRISEEADAQRLIAVVQEQLAMEVQTPGGISPDDADPEVLSAQTQAEEEEVIP